MNIVVLAGGFSPERDVSLSSGSLIANSLMDSGHRVVLVDAYIGLGVSTLDAARASPRGFTSLFADPAASPRHSFSVPSTAPDLEALKAKAGNPRSLLGPGVIETCLAADVTFIALHGAMGENGQLQATFDVLGIRYTGSPYSGCLLAMDKDVTKRLILREGIPTAEWVMIHKSESSGMRDILRKVSASAGFPCVVKPKSAGSSVGVSMADDEPALAGALESAFMWEDSIMVEKKITGREFSVGILDGKALPPIEIVPRSGFYDYANKYQAGGAKEICPAELEAEKTRELQELALATHQCLGLGSYSRVDFILDARGRFFCLEANTLPGMTPTSLLPQEAAAAGIPYARLCEMIAERVVGR